MKQAKAGAEAETFQREQTITARRASKTTPPRRERRHRRRRRPTKKVKVFTRKARRRGEKGAKNDAFKKVNGARRHRRHWSKSRPRLSPVPHSVPGSNGPGTPRRARQPAPTEGLRAQPPRPRTHHRQALQHSHAAEGRVPAVSPPPASVAAKPSKRDHQRDERQHVRAPTADEHSSTAKHVRPPVGRAPAQPRPHRRRAQPRGHIEGAPDRGRRARRRQTGASGGGDDNDAATHHTHPSH